MAQVQFYQAIDSKASHGKDQNGNYVPQGAIIFGYGDANQKGKIYLQQGPQGSESTVVCYGSITDLTSINTAISAIQTSLGEKLTASDLAGYFNYKGEVNDVSSLPGASGVSVGDVWSVTSTKALYFAKSKSTNNSISVIVVGKTGTWYETTCDVGANKVNAITESQYNQEIAKVCGQYTKPFDDSTKYPLVSGLNQTYTISINGKTATYGSMRMVPVKLNNGKLIVMLTPFDLSGEGPDWYDPSSDDSFHTLALGLEGSLQMNSWKFGPTYGGEFIYCKNGALPTDRSGINEFFTFGGGVVWEELGGVGSGSRVVVDEELTSGSSNPTQGGAVKMYIDDKITALNARIDGIGSSFQLKGSVANLTALEALTGVGNGDVYYVESEQTAYFALVSGTTVTWKQFAALNLEWK